MNGWMDGWMDGWVDGWMGGWVDEWIDERAGGCMERMDGKNGWMLCAWSDRKYGGE